ncbi:hypothetical protein V7S43_012540 [Phytophthora oleae]|uniref:PH domain-containing protein n=1 Tax=Phytophthora oleae TaxID=2107226 RepID=A0ABD3FB12_9STRA
MRSACSSVCSQVVARCSGERRGRFHEFRETVRRTGDGNARRSQFYPLLPADESVKTQQDHVNSFVGITGSFGYDPDLVMVSVQEELMTSQVFLPLHSRRAQQLFQDVLLTDSELTPQLSNKSLPERLRELQRLNLIGIQQAKRGTQFHLIRVAIASNLPNEAEEVKLTLTKDGSTLQVLGTDFVSVSLVEIKGITLHSTISHSFSLQFEEETGDNNEEIAPLSTRDIFVAESGEALNCWVVALTCGVNAFQQQLSVQPKCFPDDKEAGLVWQAVRLRIFELSGVVGMPTAIENVLRTIPDQDLEQSEALRYRLKFLQCSTTYD